MEIQTRPEILQQDTSCWRCNVSPIVQGVKCTGVSSEFRTTTLRGFRLPSPYHLRETDDVTVEG